MNLLVPILSLTLLVAFGLGGLDAAPLDTVVVEEIDVKLPHNSSSSTPHTEAVGDVNPVNSDEHPAALLNEEQKKDENSDQVPEYPRVDEDEEKKATFAEKKATSAEEKAPATEKKDEPPSLTAETKPTSAEQKAASAEQKAASAEKKVSSAEKIAEKPSLTAETKPTSAEEKAASTEKKVSSAEKIAEKPSLTTEKNDTSAEKKASSTEKIAEKPSSAEKKPESGEAKEDTASMKKEAPINATSAEKEEHEDGLKDAAKPEEVKTEDVSRAKYPSETNATAEPGEQSTNKDCASPDCQDGTASEKPTKLGEVTVPVFEDPSKKSSEEANKQQCDESEAPQSVKDAKAKLWKRRVIKVSRDPKTGKLTKETQVLSLYSDTDKKAGDEAIKKPIKAKRASDEIINDTHKDKKANASEESLPQSEAAEETAKSKDAESPADSTYNSPVSDDAAKPKEEAKGSSWGLGVLLSNLLPWLWGSPVVVVEAKGTSGAVTGMNESPSVIEDEVEEDEKKTVIVDTHKQRAADTPMISATEVNNKDGSDARAHQLKTIEEEEDDKDVKERMVTVFPDGTFGEIVTEEEDDEIVKRVVVADKDGEEKQLMKAHAKIGQAPQKKTTGEKSSKDSEDGKDGKDEGEKTRIDDDKFTKEPKSYEKAAEGEEEMDAEEQATVEEEQKTFYKIVASFFGSFTNSLFNIY